MTTENINVIKAIYDRFNGRDYSGVLEYFDPSFEWYAADNSPLADRSPYHGKDEIREGVFARIAAGFGRLTVEIDEIIDAGDKVVVLGYYDGNFAGSDKQVRAQLAHVWTVAGGKATKFQQYVDTYRIAEDAKRQAASSGSAAGT